MIHAGFHDVTGRLRLLLSESPLSEVRRIRVEQEGDTVMLDGFVRSFYAKQMAQETIRNAAHGLQIENRVRVEDVVRQVSQV